MTTTTHAPAARSGTSAADIAFHYDVSNEFYALWLDRTMSYSAGLWDGVDGDPADADTLARAQRAKLDHHLDLAGATDGSGGFQLLDVGCGWGGMTAHAVGSGRVQQATGLTLSPAQHAHMTELRMPGVVPLLESWDAHSTERPYDGIVSVGAFEHFATDGMSAQQRLAVYGAYFEKCHGWLKPAGQMSLQTIAYDDETGPDGPVGRFVAANIFPGMTLPRLAEITAACDRYFSVTVLTASPDDYARTLNSWSARLLRARSQAEELVGPEGFRRYRLYLRASESTFLRRAATLYRIGFRRRDEPLPRPA
ncbi:class I SAM-dependent methyltransferase [Streptomyces sp. RKAG337]|uniref:class I SAM-dependent methyltransferase n=1 Tax=Streptomyces sp. RKAG337 TaxID=2893404 RepID=UPI002033734B|nr:cyclopropane-fatty-acyl-phospholipid synthase family protein [Streptomyces sp. RKAG337]MCM2424929.1 cyclopropane-fatty-acyl-phospholipid synthase family protein [Streptomyces sp. RKAG337]